MIDNAMNNVDGVDDVEIEDEQENMEIVINGSHNEDIQEDEEKKIDDNQDQDDKIMDVSKIWQRFMEPEIIYFDDDEEEKDGKEVLKDEITVLNGLFMGVGRVYCGTLSEAKNIHIFGPRHHDGEDDHNCIKGYRLFHLMGKDIGYMKHIPAGNICGVGGIHDYLQKTGFITTSLNVPMMQTISTMSFPVVRVAVEPKKYKDLKNLKLGLTLLNKCDTGCEILIQSNGEYVICASGELHLARCIRDLQDTFAKILN